MKKRFIHLSLFLLIIVGLSGCITSPSTDTRSDSHDTTSATMQDATSEQNDNRNLCIGLLNIGSCNETQSTVQTSAPQATTMQPATSAGSGANQYLSQMCGGGAVILVFMLLCMFLIINFAPRN